MKVDVDGLIALLTQTLTISTCNIGALGKALTLSLIHVVKSCFIEVGTSHLPIIVTDTILTPIRLTVYGFPRATT